MPSNTAKKSGGGLIFCCQPASGVISGTVFYSNTAGTYGGAIENDNADPLTIINSVFHDNVGTLSSGAIEGASGITGRMIIDRSRFNNNIALANCCGAIASYGVLTMTNTAIFSNTTYGGASAGGGGIWILGASVISNVAIYNNWSDGFGGGLVSDGTPPVIYNSTIANNAASYGGGLHVKTGAITLTNVTLANNTAITSGGNISGIVNAVNTIIADGTPNNCGRPINSWGHNLESRNTCGLASTGDLIDTNPQLFPLGNYGGPTWSMLPMPGSPAINAGSNAACPPTDQRGFPRPAIGVCDIGAVEVSPSSVYLPIMLKNF